jgi:hypothetical protein
MNRLRCFLFAAIVVISSATLALGGEIQGPAKSNATPTPTPTVLTTPSSDSTTHGMTGTSTETIQIAWQDLATAMLRELLLTIY